MRQGYGFAKAGGAGGKEYGGNIFRGCLGSICN